MIDTGQIPDIYKSHFPPCHLNNSFHPLQVLKWEGTQIRLLPNCKLHQHWCLLLGHCGKERRECSLCQRNSLKVNHKLYFLNAPSSSDVSWRMCFIKVSISYKPFPCPGAHRWSVGWRMLKREASAASPLLSTHSLAASSFRDGIKQIVDESRCMFPCGTNHYGIINVFFFINPQQQLKSWNNWESILQGCQLAHTSTSLTWCHLCPPATVGSG